MAHNVPVCCLLQQADDANERTDHFCYRELIFPASGTEVFLRGSILWVLASSIALEIAQAQTATLSGVVRDPTQAAIVRASVTLVNNETEARRLTITNGEGAYSFPLLLPG